MNLIRRYSDALWFLFAVIICVSSASFNLWPVSESDVFHHLRAGEDILRNFHIYKTDEWSHTASGAAVYNFEWLSNVVVRVVYNIWSWPGLSYLRCAILSIWLFAMALLIRRQTDRDASRWLLMLICIPWFYFMDYFRFSMRPDAFAALFFVSLVHLWVTKALSFRRYCWISLCLLLLWANFHTGTVLVGIVASLFFILISFPSAPVLRKLLLCSATISVLFLTPQGVNVLHVLTEAAFKYDYNRSLNPDYQPFSVDLLVWNSGTWSMLWIPFVAIWGWAAAQVIKRFVESIKQTRPPLDWIRAEHCAVFFLFCGAGLLYETFHRIRVIHYEVALAAPLVILQLGEFLKSHTGAIKNKLASVIVGCAILFWGFLFYVQANAQMQPLRAGLSQVKMPIGTVEFIRRNKPKPEILNAFDFGGYLILELPEYRVSMDGRELQYFNLQNEMGMAIGALSRDPLAFENFLTKRNINIVLERYPTLRQTQNGYVIMPDFPLDPKIWGLVAFDNASLLYVRRIPENESQLEKFEFKHLKIGAPAGLGARAKTLQPDLRAAIEQEVDRCLMQPQTPVVYCLLAKAAFQESRGEFSLAKTLLTQADEINPFNEETMNELIAYYKSQNNERLSRAVERRLSFISE